MDNSWLFENEEKEEEEIESDEEEKQTELEERLYAVVHHNDLSQPLPSDLAKYYSVQCADDGELEVTLNDSLEVVKSADSEKICNLLKTSDSNLDEVDKTNTAVCASKDDDDDDVVIISYNEIKNSNNPKPIENSILQNGKLKKRFRYSDVTLSEFQGQEVNVQSSSSDIYYFHHNFRFFLNRRHRKFKNLKVPPHPSSSDWKNDSNLNFISVQPGMSKEKQIVRGMTKALVQLNPGEHIEKLTAFARVLYKKNVQSKRRKQRKERKKAMKLEQSHINNSSVDSSFNMSREIQDLSKKIKEYNSETAANPTTVHKKQKREEHFNGSISLNISPFRPDPSIPQLVDLSTEIENTTADIEDSVEGSSNIQKENSPTTGVDNSHFPTKWTKEMIKFYSKRCKTKLAKDIGEVIADLRRKSGGKAWFLDRMDQSGQYHKSGTGMNRGTGARCSNCNERGHGFQDCYRPIKLPACFLCGELYHTNYSCPHKVCMKCGTFIMSDDAFGGECDDCYYKAFNSEEPCSICGEVTHKSSNCTDLWRSFHATTGGEKKVPDNVMVNKTKSCCNCGRRGHFSHDCPFIVYSGQQISCFVKNYSAEPLQTGSLDVIISKNYADILYSDEADQFFHNLSDYTKAVIGVNGEGYEIICKINGTFEQCQKAKSEIENYVNTRKRKRQEPNLHIKKRQRVRY